MVNRLATGGDCVDSTGRRNTLISKVCDVATADWRKKASDVPEGATWIVRDAQRCDRPGGRSPHGRCPSVLEFDRDGMTTAEASLAIGVSWPVGSRWFRHPGSLSPLGLNEPTHRYLSFAERGEFAVLCAQDGGVREIARRGRARPTDDLTRTAP